MLAWLWQGVAEAECRRAGDAAEEAYHKAFRRETTADEASMDAEHHRCMNVAMRAFDAVAIGVSAADACHFQHALFGSMCGSGGHLMSSSQMELQA